METERWQRKEEILAVLNAMPDTPKPWRVDRPKIRLICVDGRMVGEAVVIVSPKDPNWWRGMAVRRGGEIRVRRT